MAVSARHEKRITGRCGGDVPDSVSAGASRDEFLTERRSWRCLRECDLQPPDQTLLPRQFVVEYRPQFFLVPCLQGSLRNRPEPHQNLRAQDEQGWRLVIGEETLPLICGGFGPASYFYSRIADSNAALKVEPVQSL